MLIADSVDAGVSSRDQQSLTSASTLPLAELHWTQERSEAIVSMLREEAKALFQVDETEQEEHPTAS